MNAVEVKNIIKTYGKKKEVTALSDISFDVKQGELFGIIGPDGAGKTSLFRILTTLLLADSGKATVDRFCGDGFVFYSTYSQNYRFMAWPFYVLPGLFS